MSESIDRVAVFVDGGNFYFKLRSLSLPCLLKFDYGGFVGWLAHGREIISRQYYVGVVRAAQNDERAQQLRINQRRLFNHLLSPSQGFQIKKGYLMRNDNVFHEKGVDVEIAVDLLVGAYENTYDTAILVSSDTDLIPAMAKVKQLGKKIEYIGFAHQPSIAMQVHATISRLLIREEFVPFVAPDELPKELKS